MSFKPENNYFLRLMSQGVIGLLLFYSLYFALWTIFFTETGNGDNVEHIHATWLVAYDKIPYKDFFQHHNPLMWYLFAPLIREFSNLITVLDVFHAIGVLFGVLTLFITYKISVRFFASPKSSLLSLLTLCPPYFYIYSFNYNPDTFMAFSFAVGLYYLLGYFEKSKLKDLVISFFAFFIAFMFTQKILVVLGVLGLISLYIFYRRKTKISDILCALQLPLAGLLLFIAYLYYNDCLGIYFKSNYIFNIRMQEYYGYNKINVMDYKMLVFSSALSIISIFVFFRKSDIYFKVISILFVWELIQRVFCFSIAPYYMLPLMIYSACLSGKLLEKMNQKNILFTIFALCIATYYAYISQQKYLIGRTTDRGFARYLSANVTPCDYVISNFLSNQSIMSKDPYYYWSLLGHIDVAGQELGIMPIPNLNELVENYKPKIIYSGMYWNNYYLNRGKQVPIQQISPYLIDKYYLPTPFSGMYILKYEYHGKHCRYNKNKKEWLYER